MTANGTASMSDDPVAGQRIVVTGADGFIGRYVSDELRDRGAEVVPLVGPSGDASVGRRVDLRSAGEAATALAAADAVVHLAARAGGVQFQERGRHEVFWDNIGITRNVLAACEKGRVGRCFLASSAVIYRDESASALTEESSLLQPGLDVITPYSWSKLTDEMVGRWFNSTGTPEVIFGRFANVFGRGATFDPDKSTVVHALVKKLADTGPNGSVEVWGDGTAVRSFVHVKDCATAIVMILGQASPGQAYNVSTSGPLAIHELAEMVKSVVSPSARLQFDDAGPVGVSRRVLDHSKLVSLGFRPRVSLRDGVRDVAAAYQDAASPR